MKQLMKQIPVFSVQNELSIKCQNMKQNLNEALMILADQFSIQFIATNQHNVKINLIVYKQQSNIRKLCKQLKLGKHAKQGFLCLFEDEKEFMKLVSETSNYNVDIDKLSIHFKLVIQAHNFKSQKTFQIKLEPIQMTETESLKCLNNILKKKLELSKNKNPDLTGNANIAVLKYEADKQIIASDANNIVIDSDSDSHQQKQQKQYSKQRFRQQAIQDNQPINHKQNVVSVSQGSSHKQKQLQPNSERNSESANNEKNNKTKSRKQLRRQQRKNKVASDSYRSRQSLTARKSTQKSIVFVNVDEDEDEGSAKEGKPRNDQQNVQKEKKITVLKGGKVRVDFKNGDFYLGEMKDGVYEGRGFYFSAANGERYDGEWKDGKANGNGVTIDKFGNKMSGTYRNDKRYGEGADEYANGQKYKGNFVKDVKSGFGKYEFKDGSYYIGGWKQNMAEGQGKEVNKDGSYYIGTWKKDNKDGSGLLYKNDKRIVQHWKNGKLISESEENQKAKKKQKTK